MQVKPKQRRLGRHNIESSTRKNTSDQTILKLGQFKEEFRLLQKFFAEYDPQGSGSIPISKLYDVLTKAGIEKDEADVIVQEADKIANTCSNITFEALVGILRSLSNPSEEPDAKAVEFMHILIKYRQKCESEGNYMEAGKANFQLQTLREREEKRQEHATKAKQIQQRMQIQIAHNNQYNEFNLEWETFLDEFDKASKAHLEQLTKKHEEAFKVFQKQIREEATSKPPKWSRELLEWRKRQHVVAKLKNYSDAQKFKAISDSLEDGERSSMNSHHTGSFAKKEVNFHEQQRAEMQALLKRINVKRKEHKKKRDMECKRLLRRNQNVQKALEGKQATESAQNIAFIKKQMQSILAGPKGK